MGRSAQHQLAICGLPRARIGLFNACASDFESGGAFGCRSVEEIHEVSARHVGPRRQTTWHRRGIRRESRDVQVRTVVGFVLPRRHDEVHRRRQSFQHHPDRTAQVRRVGRNRKNVRSHLRDGKCFRVEVIGEGDGPGVARCVHEVDGSSQPSRDSNNRRRGARAEIDVVLHRTSDNARSRRRERGTLPGVKLFEYLAQLFRVSRCQSLDRLLCQVDFRAGERVRRRRIVPLGGATLLRNTGPLRTGRSALTLLRPRCLRALPRFGGGGNIAPVLDVPFVCVSSRLLLAGCGSVI
ncbi:Uncharacterised protein [Achromobacter sp. 2789STDY5608633]|nr:Uncharacterised protein [Achromobacter sp. 2789STDY5608633]